MKKYSRLKLVFLIFYLSIAFIRAYKVPATDDTSRSFLNGDGPSDVNTLSATQYFHDFGLWESKLRPIMGYSSGGATTDLKAYTHSPALPDVISGAWSLIIDSTNEFHLRLLPILFSVAWFFLIFQLYQSLIPNPNIAFLASTLLVFSSYFLAWTDSLHLHMWSELFRFIFAYLLISFYKSDTTSAQRKLYALTMGLLAVFMANTGLHLLTFSSALVIGFSMTHQSGLKKIFAPVNVFLGLCFVFGLFGHFYFNKLYFGSWELTIKDLWEAFLFRTNQCENAEVCGLGWKEFIQFPLIILRRIERYFLIPGPAIVVFFLLMRRKLKTENPVLLSYAWSLLVAGLFWFAIMPQHAWVHHFTGRDVAIFVGLTGAYGLTEYARILKRDFELQKLWPKVYHSLFVFYLVGMALTQQALPMYWRDSFAHLFK